MIKRRGERCEALFLPAPLTAGAIGTPLYRCKHCGDRCKGDICAVCYKATPDGIAERKRLSRERRFAAHASMDVCSKCLQWQDRCRLGVPEAGTTYAALCSAYAPLT